VPAAAPPGLVSQEEIIRLAATLRAVNPAFLRKSPGRSRRWYQGGEAYFEIFADLDDDGRLCWFQLTFRGRSLTWDQRRDRLVTGRTDELDSRPVHHPASPLLALTDDLDDPLVDFARRLLECRPDDEVLGQAREVLATAHV